MEFLQDFFLLLGRVFISGMFLWGVYERVRNWNASMAFMKSRRVPQTAIVLPLAMILKTLGGLFVFFGWHAHLGALLLLIVTIPFTFWVHPFWKMQGHERQIEKAFFMKKVGIVGGLLLILAIGGGPWGVSRF